MREVRVFITKDKRNSVEAMLHEAEVRKKKEEEQKAQSQKGGSKKSGKQ